MSLGAFGQWFTQRGWFTPAFWRGVGSVFGGWRPRSSLEEQVDERLAEINAEVNRSRVARGLPPRRPASLAPGQAWANVGDHLRAAMAQVEAEFTPDQRARLHRYRDEQAAKDRAR